MKKFFVLSMAAALLLSTGNVFASSGIDFKLSVDQTSRVVAVEITVDEDRGNTAVAGLVLNDAGEVIYTSQGYTDENGVFDFSYVNNDENGSYNITVSAPRKGLSQSNSFKMLTAGMKTAISGMPKTAANIKEAIENYGPYMNLDMTAFNELSDSDSVYSFMANDKMISMADVTSVSDGFYGAVIIRTLAEKGNSTDYINFLNSEVYNILNKDGVPKGKKESLFDELNSDLKNEVLKKVISKPYKSASELSDSLEFYVLEVSIEKALQWTEVNPVMKKYKEAGLINVDFKDYKSLKNPQNADKAMIGKSFENYSEIETAFNKAVKDAKEAEQKKTNTSSGGSGGGGGGGRGGIVVSTVKTPDPVEKEKEGVKELFTDMSDYMWASEAVTYLAEKGIINGMGDGRFAPANGLTREEVSTIMVRTQKLSVDGKTSAFNDIPADRWSYPYVSAVYEAGLMIGVSDDMFGATSQITRNEFAVIMKRLIDLYDVELTVNTSTKEYDDAQNIPDWAKESVMYMKGTGLMLGSTGNQFNGSEVVSRAYACDILYSVLNAVNYDAEA